jgi:hypothetical protein
MQYFYTTLLILTAVGILVRPEYQGTILATSLMVAGILLLLPIRNGSNNNQSE